MQQLLRDRDGVISTHVGWIGGENENPTEENNAGHAEAVEVVFDHWPGKTVTRISEAGRFWGAGAEDQDYFRSYPDGCAPPFPRAGVEAANRETAA